MKGPRSWVVGLLMGTAFSLVLLEIASVLLILAARRIPFTEPYFPFRPIFPHPAVALDERTALDWTSLLSGGRVIEDPHPSLGWYSPRLRFGGQRPTPTFEPGELRIVLLGGSTVEGDGASTQESTIGGRLEHYLRTELSPAGTRVLVINEGVSGYTSTQQLILMASKIVPFYRPHYVIAIDGYNDWISTARNLLASDYHALAHLWPHTEYWPTRWVETTAGYRATATFAAALGGAARAGATEALLLTNSGWVAMSMLMMFRDRTGRPVGPDAYPWASVPVLDSDRARVHAMTERSMAGMCEAVGCRFLWALQPLFTCQQRMSETDQRILRSRPGEFWHSLERYYADLRTQVANDPGFWRSRMVDYSCLGAEASQAFHVDYVHLSEFGQDRLARELTTWILRDLPGFSGQASRP